MFPVEEKLDDIRAALRANRDVVLTAPPGSGKTTCVPAALINEPWLNGKKIIMLEPRRLAARNCAAFIAKKRGERVGETVGFSVRLERKVSSATRLEIVTEGLLTNRILADAELSDVGLVIFDEFHERSLNGDLAFALALEIRRALRSDLRLLVMSATLDADEVAEHLGDATVVRAEGRMFPVETRYLGDISMPAAIAVAFRETAGDLLCFLPGEGEIRRVREALPAMDAEILPFYGSLPKEEQDRVFERTGKRKIVLATSIAETSLTIEGIRAVVDSGLMRVPRFSPSTGMSGLVTLPLTLDRAEQRRGRAGRLEAGVCYRLWTPESEASRPPKMSPEIFDADLTSLVLVSLAWGALQREDLPWMTLPPSSAWDRAVGLLKLLGAIDTSSGRLTAKGELMAKMPMHPRLANMLLATSERHESKMLDGREVDVGLLAAIIEEGGRSRESDIRYVPITPRIRELAKRFSRQTAFFSPGAALAFAYPDRIAKNRGNGSFCMVSGRGAYFEDGDPLAKAPYLVCCELDDRVGDAKIFLGCPVDEEEIISLFEDQLVEESYCAWDRKNERVKSVIRRKLGAMVLKEREDPVGRAGVGAMNALVEGIRIKGVENLPCWTKAARQLKARINFVARILKDWPAIDERALLAAIPGFAEGIMKWSDLEALDLLSVMDFILSEAGHDRRELDRLAPEKMEVPTGSKMTIHYEGAEPTVEVRLQECFGLMETPKVAGGKVPIVMTLLSPAQRPIQITKDLAGFWRGAYQLVRKDMRGRYPKHYWPEDPFSAIPTRRTRPSW